MSSTADTWIRECEVRVRAAAPALHDDDVRMIALDIERLVPGVNPGAAVDRYFGPGEMPTLPEDETRPGSSRRATGVLTNRRPSAVPTDGLFASGKRYVETVDPETGLTVFRAPGLAVVVLENGVTQERFNAAVNLLAKLKQHPLHLSALAFPSSRGLRANFEGQLARRGIILVDVEAESPRARGLKFVEQFVARREHGTAHVYAHARRVSGQPAAEPVADEPPTCV